MAARSKFESPPRKGGGKGKLGLRTPQAPPLAPLVISGKPKPSDTEDRPQPSRGKGHRRDGKGKGKGRQSSREPSLDSDGSHASPAGSRRHTAMGRTSLGKMAAAQERRRRQDKRQSEHHQALGKIAACPAEEDSYNEDFFDDARMPSEVADPMASLLVTTLEAHPEIRDALDEAVHELLRRAEPTRAIEVVEAAARATNVRNLSAWVAAQLMGRKRPFWERKRKCDAQAPQDEHSRADLPPPPPPPAWRLVSHDAAAEETSPRLLAALDEHYELRDALDEEVLASLSRADPDRAVEILEQIAALQNPRNPSGLVAAALSAREHPVRQNSDAGSMPEDDEDPSERLFAVLDANVEIRDALDDAVIEKLAKADPDRALAILEEVIAKGNVRNPSAFVTRALGARSTRQYEHGRWGPHEKERERERERAREKERERKREPTRTMTLPSAPAEGIEETPLQLLAVLDAHQEIRDALDKAVLAKLERANPDRAVEIIEQIAALGNVSNPSSLVDAALRARAHPIRQSGVAEVPSAAPATRPLTDSAPACLETYDPETEAQLDRWVIALRNKDFETSDWIRQELRSKGIEAEAARPKDIQVPDAHRGVKLQLRKPSASLHPGPPHLIATPKGQPQPKASLAAALTAKPKGLEHPAVSPAAALTARLNEHSNANHSPAEALTAKLKGTLPGASATELQASKAEPSRPPRPRGLLSLKKPTPPSALPNRLGLKIPTPPPAPPPKRARVESQGEGTSLKDEVHSTKEEPPELCFDAFGGWTSPPSGWHERSAKGMSQGKGKALDDTDWWQQGKRRHEKGKDGGSAKAEGRSKDGGRGKDEGTGKAKGKSKDESKGKDKGKHKQSKEEPQVKEEVRIKSEDTRSAKPKSTSSSNLPTLDLDSAAVPGTLLVEGLPESWGVAQIRPMFTFFGIEGVALVLDPRTDSRVALVRLKNPDSALKVIDQVHGSDVEGGVISCKLFVPEAARENSHVGDLERCCFFVDELPMPGRPDLASGPWDVEVFLENLPFDQYTEAQIAEWLSSFGPVDDLRLLHEHETGELSGQAYVRFLSHEVAATFLADQDPPTLDSRITAAWSESERLVQGVDSIYMASVNEALETIVATAATKEVWMLSEARAWGSWTPTPIGKQLHFIVSCSKDQYSTLHRSLADALAAFHEEASKHVPGSNSEVLLPPSQAETWLQSSQSAPPWRSAGTTSEAQAPAVVPTLTPNPAFVEKLNEGEAAVEKARALQAAGDLDSAYRSFFEGIQILKQVGPQIQEGEGVEASTRFYSHIEAYVKEARQIKSQLDAGALPPPTPAASSAAPMSTGFVNQGGLQQWAGADMLQGLDQHIQHIEAVLQSGQQMNLEQALLEKQAALCHYGGELSNLGPGDPLTPTLEGKVNTLYFLVERLKETLDLRTNVLEGTAQASSIPTIPLIHAQAPPPPPPGAPPGPPPPPPGLPPGAINYQVPSIPLYQTQPMYQGHLGPWGDNGS